jgi:hypothetical protein
MTKREFEINLTVKVKTNRPVELIKTAIRRGIFRGLDTEPTNIAPPSEVEVIFLK